MALERIRSLPWVRRAWRFVHQVIDEWSKDRCTGLSAEIAFWLVLSIFPGLLVFGATLGWLDSVFGADVAGRIENRIIEGIETALGSESGPISQAASDLFESPSAGALTFGVLFAVFSFTRGFNALVSALDVAYDIDTSRSWFHARASAIVLGVGTILVGALTLTVLVLGPLFGRGELGTWFTATWQQAGPFIAFVVLVAWATTIYHVAPLHLTPWRWDVPGAIVAAVFWVLATLGFRLYVDSAISGSNAILGAVGGVLTLLLWVYLLTIGLMLGAEINQVLAEQSGVSVSHDDRRTVRRSVQDAASAARRAGRRVRGKGDGVVDPADASGDPPVT